MLKNAYAPSTESIINTCKKLANDDDILNYLSEIASYDYQCPDACDKWAMDFLEENEGEIYE